MAEANDGLLLLRPGRVEPERTVIVTGLARSGTSMVAALLHAAGLPLGTELDAVVREDREIARNLGQPGLAPVVAARNAAHAVWGFKRPNLHAFGPDFVSAFRHPRVIVTCRDAVALGRRSMLSEHHQDRFAAREAEAAALEGLALLRFASALPCPVLLVSYEKAVQAPLRLARALLGFTGLAADAAVVAQAVQADHPDYLVQTERRFHGFIDGIQGDVMHGWAADPTSPAPLTLELLVDGAVRAAFPADQFRPDLAAHGIGTGHHGFKQTLPAGLRRMAKLAVRVAGRTHELDGSGRPLKAWATRR